MHTDHGSLTGAAFWEPEALQGCPPFWLQEAVFTCTPTMAASQVC